MLLLAALCAAAGHLYVVVTTPDASPTEAFAAHELSTLVGNISNGNVPLEVFNLSAVPVGRTMRLYVGYSASVGAGVAETDLAGLGSDGFRVAVHYNHPSLCAGCAAISGGKAARRGALYGAYELLERFGLEFIAWDETTLPPDAPYASLEALMPGADIVQTPSYGYRDLGDWHPYSNRLHARRMRLNNNAFYECVENTANPACKGEQAWDMFHYASPPGMGHSIYRLLCSNGTDGNPRGMCDDPLKPPQAWPHAPALFHLPFSCPSPLAPAPY